MAAFINVFAFLFALAVTVRCECQEGFTRYGDSCYLAIQLRFHWADARTLCKSMGAHLLEIDSAAEMSTIKGFFAQFNFGMDTWWLGATNIQDDFEYRWEDSKKALTYKPWAHLQPDNADGKQHCLSLDKHFKFDDKDCDFDHVSFICEASYHFTPPIVG